MGTYLYSLRSPSNMRSVIVEKSDGSVEELILGTVRYQCKPSTCFDRRNGGVSKNTLALLGRLEKLWDGWTRPQYAAHTYDTSLPSVGDPVYFWEHGAPFNFDDGSGTFGKGTLIGKITHINKGDGRVHQVLNTYIAMIKKADNVYRESAFASAAQNEQHVAYRHALAYARERLTPVVKDPVKRDLMIDEKHNLYSMAPV